MASSRDGAGEAAASADTVERERRETARDIAYKKILGLQERIKALKLLQQANPKGLPGAVAQIARELAAAVKEYRAAGGKGPAPAAPPAGESNAQPATPEEQRALDAYRETQLRERGDRLELEWIQDSATVRDARGMIKALREYLKAGLTANKTPDAARDAKRAIRDMRDSEKLLDGIEGDANSARLESKLIERQLGGRGLNAR